jgi:histidinol-phosphate aminotransferase
MEIRPTKETLSCERVPNEPISRLPFLRLDKNENTVGFPPSFLKDMFAGLTPDIVASYPEPFILQDKLASFLGVPAKQIMLTTGSDAGIKVCFEALIKNGDGFVRIDPTYAMVGVYAKLFGADEKIIGYDRELNLDARVLLAAIKEGVRLVYLANPNSPTGTIINDEDIRALCSKAKQVGAVVMVDEAYYYFYDHTALGLLGEFDNLVVIRTISKAMGLASARLGYLVASEKLVDWFGRWRPMYEINAYAQHFGTYVLDHWSQARSYVDEVVEAREWFVSELKKAGLDSFRSHANFVLVKYPKENIADTVDEFKRNKIIIKGGGGVFPLSETLRFTIGTREQMARCLEILRRRA